MTLNPGFTTSLERTIEQLKTDKVYKTLNYLDSPQSARVQMEGRGEVLILSSNNYLGLCDEPSVIEAGIDGLKRFGAGTASVRFIIRRHLGQLGGVQSTARHQQSERQVRLV